jgi:hypothetical protein
MTPNNYKVTGAPPQRFAKLQARTGASALTTGLGRTRLRTEKIEQPIWIQRMLCGKMAQGLPNNMDRLTVAFDAKDPRCRIQRFVDKTGVIDLDDLVSIRAIVGKYILQRSDVPEVSNFRPNFFTNFAYHRGLTCFTKFDTTSQWAIKGFLFDRIMSLDHQDSIISSKDAYRERPNSGRRHFADCEA